MIDYLSNVISESYKEWGSRKIFLNAPTGSGKTTFILKRLLPYYKEQNYKLLILCNRRMLEEQYEASLATMYETYAEYDNVEVQSYQQFARTGEEETRRIQEKFYGICLDECHYFVQDSDFNSETYELWQRITGRFYSKQMIFISATMECVRPFIEYFKGHIPNNDLNIRRSTYQEFIDDDRYTVKADYSYFRLRGVSNQTELCKRIVDDTGKALIFINSKDGARNLKKLLEDNGLKKGTAKILNADELTKQDSLKDYMVYGEKFPQDTKVLITTSVLDNGVSLTDDDITSITVFSTSRTDFIQMVGRVRVAKTDSRCVKLYVVERSSVELYPQKMYLDDAIEIIDECENSALRMNSKRIALCLSELLKDSRKGEILRKIIYLKCSKQIVGNKECICSYDAYLNPMCIHKIKQNRHDVTAAYANSMKDARYVPNLQAKWLGFESEDIMWESEDFVKVQIRKCILEKMQEKINNETLREVKEAAVQICVKFNVAGNYGFRNGRTPDTKKFINLCESLGLELERGKENNITWYRVCEKGDNI